MSKLLDKIRKDGHGPRVGLKITPLRGENRREIILDQFLSYNFSSSVLVPVDSFSFTFKMPDLLGPLSDYIREGDTVELTVAKETICTGIVDVVDIETTIDGADTATIMGRNLLGQLEDNAAVNVRDDPMYASKLPVTSVVSQIIAKTRIRQEVKTRQVPEGSFLFATDPAESKLSALQRFIEPLNCLMWSDPVGRLVIGRPRMSGPSSGNLTCDRENRVSNKTNVIGMKAVRASTQIPNNFIPFWVGQENIQSKLKEQSILNESEGPTRLRKAGHFVSKAVVVSTPSGSDPSALADINFLLLNAGNLLRAYAVREIARANFSELIVQASIKGHVNDDLKPILIDQNFQVNYPRAGVVESMYVYQVDYSMDAANGPRTMINLCKFGTLVAGISIAQVEERFRKVEKA